MRLTAPGNLLLLGEYAVTEQGGLGVALAVDRRVVMNTEPAPELMVEGRWGGRALRWTRDSADQSPLISAIVEAWQEQCSMRADDRAARGYNLPEARILIDSSALFSGGRKSGFGSSAAVTVALTCTLLHLSGLRGGELTRLASRIALTAHRRAQGGRGSGYDIFASLYGGFGCLVGGRQPSWQFLRLPWLPPLYLFRGRSSVSTPDSLKHYERWKSSDPLAGRRFLGESNEGVRAFLEADGWPQALPAFKSMKRLGIWLGRQIGVSAEIEVPPSLEPELCKALGAGNEVGMCLGKAPASESALEPVAVAPEGVRWYT
jgi:phosphomevalonate kinase